MAADLAERGELAPADVAEGCARVERYFTQALPLHVRDEEESILPRLRGRAPELDAALARMHDEHLEHERPVGELVALCRALAALAAQAQGSGGDDSATRRALAEVARSLVAAFERHLAEEERVIVPAIRDRLSRDEQAAIVAELRARRR